VIDFALWEDCEARHRAAASNSVALRDFVFDRWAEVEAACEFNNPDNWSEARIIIATDEGLADCSIYLPKNLEDEEWLGMLIWCFESGTYEAAED